MDYDEEILFLTSVGLENLVENFREEEIFINLFPELTDDNLKELGITTIGRRIKFRNDARNWIKQSKIEIVENAIEFPTIVENTIIEPEISENEEGLYLLEE